MLCLNCNKEVVQTEGKKSRLYCNTTCKSAYIRNKARHIVSPEPSQIVSESNRIDHIVSELDQARYIDKTDLVTGVTCPTAPVDNPDMLDLTRQQIMGRIQSYLGVSWIDSPEYAELIDRLLTINPISLQAEGYFIPSWIRLRAA